MSAMCATTRRWRQCVSARFFAKVPAEDISDCRVAWPLLCVAMFKLDRFSRKAVAMAPQVNRQMSRGSKVVLFMSTSSGQQTLADYVAIAISPALIVALVGSLIFFLVEVLLGPQYPAQLLWILFFAVFGAVLVSRISMMTDIADRAGMYAIVLGALVWVALMAYVKYPAQSRLAAFDWLVNGGLILVTWWSAHRLTRDSTLVDDNVDASGAGLLQAAGLEKNSSNKPTYVDAEEHGKRKARPSRLRWVDCAFQSLSSASQPAAARAGGLGRLFLAGGVAPVWPGAIADSGK